MTEIIQSVAMKVPEMAALGGIVYLFLKHMRHQGDAAKEDRKEMRTTFADLASVLRENTKALGANQEVASQFDDHMQHRAQTEERLATVIKDNTQVLSDTKAVLQHTNTVLSEVKAVMTNEFKHA
jgi:Mg2+ and Co2+ transporter CorA